MNGERMKLYSAYSVINEFRERNHVTFNWYCHRRDTPTVPYEISIANYTALKTRGEHIALEKQADALFTESEIQSLRSYLHEHHDTELFAEPANLPLGAEKRLAAAWEEMASAEGAGCYMLSMEEAYTLPIEVRACYDLKGCAPTETAAKQAQVRRPGVRFIQEVHQALGIKIALPEQRLDQVVAALYAARGFAVSQEPVDRPPDQTPPPALPAREIDRPAVMRGNAPARRSGS